MTTLFAAGWTVAPLLRVRCLGTCLQAPLFFFPLATAPVVGSVVAPEVAAFMLLLWGRAVP
jgi:hypothetical protein